MRENYSVTKLRAYAASVKPPSIPDALRLMRDTREALESLDEKDHYPVLNLYCNWCVHPLISSSNVGYLVLRNVNFALANTLTPGGAEADFELLRDAANRLFSVPELRRQLKEFYSKHGVDVPVVDSYNGWTGFLHSLYQEILGKQIMFPNAADLVKRRFRAAKKLRDEIVQEWISKSGSADRIVSAIALVYPRPRYTVDGVLEQAASYRWELILEAQDRSGATAPGVILIRVAAGQTEPPYVFKHHPPFALP